MRADRLISVLMLLQRHGQVTVSQIAEELEISPRTARRDLEALDLAGVPVYATRGRGGGWRLVGGARTDLTGLTGPEVRALFIAAGSAPGQSPEVSAALAKLQHAVPAPFRAEAAQAAEAVFVDRTAWGLPATQEPPPLLARVQDAVARGRRVELAYTSASGDESDRIVDPLGLVERQGTWYLVAQTAAGRRTFRVDRVRSVRVLDEAVERPEGFNLADAWEEISAEIQDRRHPARLSARVRPWALSVLLRPGQFRVASIGPADREGWVQVELSGYSMASLTGLIAGFADSMQVTEPPEARAMLADIGRSLTRAYAESTTVVQP